MPFALSTPRLMLREWREDDATAFATMWADPGLTEFLLPPDEAWIARVRAYWGRRGFGQFVVALPGAASFTRDPTEDFDFDHPRLPPGHPLRPHVLYRMRR